MAASYEQPITVIQTDDEDEDSEGSLPPLGTDSSDDDDVSNSQALLYPLVNGTGKQQGNGPAAIPTAVSTAVARPGAQARPGLRSGFLNAGGTSTAAVVQKVTVDDEDSSEDEDDGPPDLGVNSDHSDHSDMSDDGPPGLEDGDEVSPCCAA
jgi:hypothetical protein